MSKYSKKSHSTDKAGVKAAAGQADGIAKDKVAAFRKQFDGYAAKFFETEHAIGEAQASKLSILLSAADTTSNNADAIEALRESWKVTALASGLPERTASVYASEAVKITTACYLSVAVKTDKDGKVTYDKLKAGQKGKSGKAIMADMGYIKARGVAGQIRKLNGVGSKFDNKRTIEKVWTKEQLAAALKVCMDKARKMADVDVSVVVHLGDVLQAIKAKTAKVKGKAVQPAMVMTRNTNAPVLTNQFGKAVVKGSKAWQQMSRGQKAAASRRANGGTHTIQ